MLGGVRLQCAKEHSQFEEKKKSLLEKKRELLESLSALNFMEGKLVQESDKAAWDETIQLVDQVGQQLYRVARATYEGFGRQLERGRQEAVGPEGAATSVPVHVKVKLPQAAAPADKTGGAGAGKHTV